MADKYERFVASYLRLNGYFTVPSFIVHAADDPARVSAGMIGNYTETDIIGIRMPHSREATGTLRIANDRILVEGAVGKIDVVIAEVKSGGDTTPNRVWRVADPPSPAISYIARFVGLHIEAELDKVAKSLAASYRYEDERSRFRYILFSREANQHYQQRGVSYITFEQAVSFIVEVRGQCWIGANIGVASVHQQWDELLVQVFEIANRPDLSVPERIKEIQTILAT